MKSWKPTKAKEIKLTHFERKTTEKLIKLYEDDTTPTKYIPRIRSVLEL